MAKPELGTKRICPETGRKFYDLNRDPIVSPYTGKSYPLTYFDENARERVVEADDEEEVKEVDVIEEEADTVPLEDADEDTTEGKKTAVPDVDGDDDEDDVEIDDDEDDTFLPDDDDDDDDDMSDIIGDVNDDEEES